MPVTVVVGGQFGSEGKGKVAYALAKTLGVRVAVRVGGSNSGHTVVDDDGTRWVLRHLPTPALLPSVINVLPPGTYIDVGVLLDEVARLGLDRRTVLIDPNAAIVGEEERDAESSGILATTIGSTLSGTGATVANRIARDGSVMLAHEIPELKPYIRDTLPRLRSALDAGERVLIEGTQGYGLSLLHSSHYPYATSRDTTAAAALSETGLSPIDVDQIVLVIRAFPIRVGGNSGPLPEELTWGAVAQEGGHDHDLSEFTSVTGRLRRVARFDPTVVRRAIAANAPTLVVLNHADYFDHTACRTNQLTPPIRRFVQSAERDIGHRIDLVGVGPTVLFANNASASRLVEVSG
jgi:adenylosuccinate synthase